MAVRALTLDFWNTMVVAKTNSPRRQKQRLNHLLHVVRTHRPDTTEATIKAAYREAAQRYDRAWKEEHRTPGTSSLVHSIWETLNLTLEDDQHIETVQVFEEGLLFGPPDFVEGLEDIVAWASQHYRLGIISDTMFSPGRTIRQLLHQRGLLQYFEAFVFSDEVGFSKPDIRAFAQASNTLGVATDEMVHIGDLRRTDIAGAQNAGLKAVLFTGVHEDEGETPRPHAILSHWQALPEILETLDTA